jgi:hypothetical protein
MSALVTRAGCIGLLLLALSGTASTQSGSVLSNIDVPAPDASVSAGSLWIGGWAFDCTTGQMPTEATIGLWNYDTGQWIFPARYFVVRGIYRPDVQAAFIGACPTMGAYNGFVIYLTQPPSGHYRVAVTWASSYGAHATTREVQIW